MVIPRRKYPEKFAKPMASHLAMKPLRDGGCPYDEFFLGRTRWRGHSEPCSVCVIFLAGWLLGEFSEVYLRA